MPKGSVYVGAAKKPRRFVHNCFVIYYLHKSVLINLCRDERPLQIKDHFYFLPYQLCFTTPIQLFLFGFTSYKHLEGFMLLILKFFQSWNFPSVFHFDRSWLRVQVCVCCMFTNVYFNRVDISKSYHLLYELVQYMLLFCLI